MKKLIAAAAALAMIAPVAVQAKPVNHGQMMSRKAHMKNNWHRFKKGERFDRSRAQNYRVVDYRSYRSHLRAPPRGYHWVRSGNDALLVAVTSGIVASVVAGLFH